MVTERLHLTTNDGQTFEPEIKYSVVSYRNYLVLKQFNLSVFVLQWFTEWDSTRNCTNVDTGAPTWYIKLAALFDAIYHTDSYKEMLPSDLPPIGDVNRRVEVEKYIISLTDKNHRIGYIWGRKTYYQTLIDTGLFLSVDEASVKATLSYLNSELAK